MMSTHGLPRAGSHAPSPPPAAQYAGWCQVAFERDLEGELTPVAVGERRFVVARTAAGVRTFDADCPHRGAHLGRGGRLDGERIVCPFHGYRIGLGVSSVGGADHGFRVREYRTLVVGGLVLALLSAAHEHGLTAFLEGLNRTHYFVPGFALPVRVRADLVTENGFDNTHFREVHGVGTAPEMFVSTGEHGELVAEGQFELPYDVGPGSDRANRAVRARYVARAFSPWLIISEVRAAHPYSVITAPVPTPDGGCVIRLSLVVPGDGGPPSADWCRSTLRHSREGLERDRVVWENLSPTAPGRLTIQDAPVVAFREFCRHFEPDGGASNDAPCRGARGTGG